MISSFFFSLLFSLNSLKGTFILLTARRFFLKLNSRIVIGARREYANHDPLRVWESNVPYKHEDHIAPYQTCREYQKIEDNVEVTQKLRCAFKGMTSSYNRSVATILQHLLFTSERPRKKSRFFPSSILCTLSKGIFAYAKNTCADLVKNESAQNLLTS